MIQVQDRLSLLTGRIPTISPFVFAALTAIGGFATTHAQAQNGPEYIPGRYIVTLHDKGDREEEDGDFTPVDAVSRRQGITVQQRYGHAKKGFAADITPAALAQLKTDPRVARIEQDQVIRLSGKPSRGGGGGGTTQPAQTIPWGIKRIAADQSSTIAGNGSGSVDVDIAIIDTGIDTTHPDLKVVGGRNFTGGSTTAYSDGNGHGTHVAGTVAALDNTIGVVGVAPGARLWAVRVLDSTGSGTMSGVIAGVDWVTANAATIEVANMSLGGGDSPTLNSALAKAVAAGVTFAVAAGNSTVDTRGTSPANSTSTGVITVSALDQSNNLAYFSNFGLNYVDDSNSENGVDVIAPGVNIYSTYMGGKYATMSGTSMASPHVTGTAALCKAKNPGFTPAQVKASVMQSAPSVYLGTGPGGIYGISPWSAIAGDRDAFYEPLINAAAY